MSADRQKRSKPMANRLAQFVFGFIFAYAALSHVTLAQTAPAKGPHWVAVWTASAHGPYPIGNPTDARFLDDCLSRLLAS